MTDETPTAPADPHEVNTEAEFDPEAIIETAQKTFSLADRLKGIKHRHAKVLVFTDLDAVDEHALLNGRLTALVDAAGRIKVNEKTSAKDLETHAALVAEHNRLEPELEKLKADMLQSALSIHLHAYPNIAVKTARRAARKTFHNEVLGGVPQDPETQEAIAEWMDFYLLGHAIVKVVDSSGESIDLGPREELGKMLSDTLPPSQWKRLHDAFIRLTITDQIGSAATDDPGF